MSETFKPGGPAPGTVRVLDRHYRVTMQPMTAWGTAEGFALYHYLGVVSERTARATCADHAGEIRGRIVVFLESAPIGCEAFSKVIG